MNGLETNIIVYNYHIREKTTVEIKKFKWVKEMRRIEIKEKLIRK